MAKHSKYFSRLHRRVALAAAVFLAAGVSSSQQLFFKNYARANGLASDYILCLYQDREGFIWFGTDRGVSRYDGHEFVTFTTNDGLGSNFVQTIFQDRDGAMWFGTYEGGVTRFDGVTFRSFEAHEGFSLRDIVSIAQDDEGRIFVSGDSSIVAFDRERFEFVASNHDMGSLVYCRDGGMYVTRGNEMYSIRSARERYADSSPMRYRIERVLRTHARFTSRAVVISDNEVLVPTGKGVHRLSYSKTEKRWHDSLVAPNAMASCLARDKRGALWFGTAGSGLSRVKGNRTTKFGAKQGLAKERVESLLCDYEGNLWVGTFGGGAQKLLSADMQIYKEADGLPGNDVTKIFLDSRRRVWVGAERGVAVIDRDTVYRIPAIKEGRGFAEDRLGRMYIGNLHSLFGPYTLRELSASQLTRARAFSYGVSGMSLRGNVSAETLWAGSYGFGVRRFIGDSTREFHTADGLPSEMSEDVVDGSTGVWFLSRTVGATRYRDGTFESFTTADGIPSNTVHCVLENGDGIWFGTSKGIAHFRDGRSKVLNESHGLKGENVFSIFKTSRHAPEHPSLWILTDQALHRFENGEFHVFGSVAGFLFESARMNYACYDDQTETLWLATTGGVVRIYLSQLEAVSAAPRVIITDIKSDTTLITRSLSDASSPLHLEHADHNITIGYAGLSFADERSVRYKAKLSGIESDWGTPTQEVRVSYRNLPAGSYIFSVIAINPDGVESSAPATVSFVIPPPFWKSWWFGTIAGLALAAAFGFVVRNAAQKKLKAKVEELERERAIQRERERISRDLHDHVGSQLVNIISGLDLVGKYSPPTEKRSERLLKSLQQDARSSMIQLRETIWALKGQPMPMEKFIEQVENYSRKQLEFQEEIQLRFESTCEASFELSPIQVLNCFRIVQEALANCVKHAHATTVCIGICARVESGLQITVKDDGVGIRAACNGETQNPESATADEGYVSRFNGQGVLNMTKRAEEMGGKFNMSQVNGRGTQVEILLPFK
jgi:signal transduction histidine kinase/streptogramin lyase